MLLDLKFIHDNNNNHNINNNNNIVIIKIINLKNAVKYIRHKKN